MGVLLPKIKPLIYSNGGPVITVQVRINNWMHYDLKVTNLPKAAYTTTILPCVAGALEEMWTQKRTERTRGARDGDTRLEAICLRRVPRLFSHAYFFQAPVTQVTILSEWTSITSLR